MSRLMQVILTLVLGGLLVGCLRPPAGTRIYRDLEFARTPQRALKLDLYLPSSTNEIRPVLIWIHGGAWKEGTKDRCPLGLLANQYAVVSIEYRLSTEAHWPAQLLDIRSAIRWIKNHAQEYQYDPERIALVGASAGGHLASLAGTTGDILKWEGEADDLPSVRVQAICALYPPTDLDSLVTSPYWRKSPRGDVARFLGCPVAQCPENAAMANPIRYVSPGDPPFFLVHGEKDRVVPLEQSFLLHEALRKTRVPSELRVIPNGKHGLIPSAGVRVEILDFLSAVLNQTAAANPLGSPAGEKF